jgi:hypothetical protein
MPEDANRNPNPPSRAAAGSATEDVARIIQAWDNGVAKWQQRHDSIPAAFVELAHVIEGIQRRAATPNGRAEARRAKGVQCGTEASSRRRLRHVC